MRHHELVETVQDAFAEVAVLNAAIVAAAERALSALAELGGADTACILCVECRHRRLASDRPLVDAATYTVEWHGRRCDLGPTILFKLIEHLSRRSDCYYSYSILIAEVWDRRCESTTVRSAVKRLRRALREAGMSDLADAIKGRGERYGLFLNGDGH